MTDKTLATSGEKRYKRRMGHHHGHHHHGAAQGAHNPHEAAMKRVTLVAVGVASLLVLAKISGWSETHATSLLSSLLDSLFDVSMSGLNYFAVRYAVKPADDDHRFGHSSIEDIVGLGQFTFIMGTMLLVMFESADALLNPQAITAPDYGIGVMVFSLVMTIGLVIYQRHVARQTGSNLVLADSLHYISDILMNGSIIASLLAASFLNVHWLDPILGIIIAMYIIYHAWEIGVRSFNNLMDHEMAESEKETIAEIMTRHTNILSHHNLRTRQSGGKSFIQMDVRMAADMTLRDAHKVTDAIEKELQATFPHADIIIHQEPSE